MLSGSSLRIDVSSVLVQDLPQIHGPCSVHRMAEPVIRGAASWAKTTMTGGDHLKRVDSRLKRPAGTFITEYQDGFAPVKAGLSQLLAVRQRTAVLRVPASVSRRVSSAATEERS